jgi:hypothetical protein
LLSVLELLDDESEEDEESDFDESEDDDESDEDDESEEDDEDEELPSLSLYREGSFFPLLRLSVL